MTELKFTVMALGQVSEEFQTRLLVYDGKVKACRARNEVWEALLSFVALFFPVTPRCQIQTYQHGVPQGEEEEKGGLSRPEASL